MTLLRSFLLAICIVAACGSGSARADCKEQTAKFALDSTEYGAAELKSYLCSTGNAQVGVTFMQFGDLPASLIVGKVPSKLLTRLIGKPKIIENEVLATYASLIRDVGVTESVPDGLKSLKLNDTGINPDLRSADLIGAPKLRTLMGLQYANVLPDRVYPAAREITSLRAETIPNGMGFFYDVTCGDDDPAPDADCQKVGRVAMKFWRPLGAADIAGYVGELRAFNLMLRRLKKSPMVITTGVPAELKLAQHLAGPNWPDDFIVMVGDNTGDSCGDNYVVAGGWEFSYWTRAPQLDAILIQNMSTRPIAIGEMFGSRSAEKGLRPTKSSRDSEMMGNLATTLAPGERILVPNRVGLAVKDGLRREFEQPHYSRQLYRARGAGTFKGYTGGYGMPDLRDYTFGPELTINGLTIDGTRQDFDKKLDNAFDMAVSSEALSCPYLAAWQDGEWVSHGKVLDRAPNRDREYTDTRVSAGFVSRFRIEEREPEVAYIDQAELLVSLKNGEVLTLQADDPRLADRDQDYVELAWGEAIDFAFALPDGVAERDVTESRLNVTGYYRRYSALMAERRAPSRSSIDRLRLTAEPVSYSIARIAPAESSACSASIVGVGAILPASLR